MKYLLLALAIYVLSCQIDCKNSSQLSSISASPESEKMATKMIINKKNFVRNFWVKTKNAFADMYKEQSRVKSATSYTPCFWKICSRPLNKQRYQKYATATKNPLKIIFTANQNPTEMRKILTQLNFILKY